MENEIKKAGHEFMNAAKSFLLSIIIGFFEGWLFFNKPENLNDDLYNLNTFELLSFFAIIFFLFGIFWLYSAGRTLLEINAPKVDLLGDMRKSYVQD